MITANPRKADSAVLAFLREHGTGPLTIGEIAAATGLARVTIRTSLYLLHYEKLVCFSQYVADYGTSRYVIHHLHPGEPGDPQ